MVTLIESELEEFLDGKESITLDFSAFSIAQFGKRGLHNIASGEFSAVNDVSVRIIGMNLRPKFIIDDEKVEYAVEIFGLEIEEKELLRSNGKEN